MICSSFSILTALRGLFFAFAPQETVIANFKYSIHLTHRTMAETLELDSFEINFSFRCPKCDYLNEEVPANDLSSGNAECGMCETIFKVEGLDTVKITATLE